MRQLAQHLSNQPAIHGLPHLHLLQHLFRSDYHQELQELLYFCRGDLEELCRILLVAYLELQLQAGEDKAYLGPEQEALRSSLHSFSGGIKEICLQQTAGVLSPEAAYRAVRKQWKQLKASRKALKHQ